MPESTIESNGLGRFIESMLPTGLTPFSFGFGGALFKQIFGKSLEDLVKSIFPSTVASVTKSGLTGQQIAENEYTAMREDTRYQRFVDDLDKAGINSAMLLGRSVQPSSSSPSASDSGTSIAGSFSNLLELATLPARLENLRAETKNTEADTDKKKSETEGQNISNQFAAELNRSALDSQAVVRELNRHQIHEVDAKIDNLEQNRQNLIVDMKKSIKEMSVMDAQISRIDTQNLESMADILLKRASASRIVSLLPYEKLYMSAKTDAERGAAAASFAQAAWQNGLIDAGYVETTCKALEITNSINEVKAALTNPNYDYDSAVLDTAGRAIMATISAMLNPIKGIVSF